MDKLRRLSQVVERIREKYGDEAIRRASSLGLGRSADIQKWMRSDLL